MSNPFKHALQAGQPQIGIWSTIASPYVSELLSGAGYDWILLDTEHTPADVPQMLNHLQAVAAAVPGNARLTHPVVRPAWNDTVMIKRYLDIGATTLLLPFVQNADEARQAVAATRYPPHGVRGVGGSTRASNFGRTPNYIHHANDDICVLVQVETREALTQIEAIASVDGVDGIFIGPADLSASLGHPGAPGHPEVVAAIDDAIARIRACGKAPGILMPDLERARQCLDRGALFVAVGVDTVMLKHALDTTLATVRAGDPAADDAPAAQLRPASY